MGLITNLAPPAYQRCAKAIARRQLFVLWWLDPVPGIAGMCCGGTKAFKMPMVLLRSYPDPWTMVELLVHESLHWLHSPATVYESGEAFKRHLADMATMFDRAAHVDLPEEQCVVRVTEQLLENARRDFKDLDSAEAILDGIAGQIAAGKITLERTRAMDPMKMTSEQRMAAIALGAATLDMVSAYLKAVQVGVEFPPDADRAMRKAAVEILGPKAPPEWREQ